MQNNRMSTNVLFYNLMKVEVKGEAILLNHICSDYCECAQDYLYSSTVYRWVLDSY